MENDLPKGSFYGLVVDKIAVDLFKPKFGDEKDFVVFSLFVNQKDIASKLMNYIVQKNFDLLDVEVSPHPKEDGKYILFIEMNRNKDMFATMDKLLLHIDHLVSIKQWYFKTSAYKEYMDWDRGNFVKIVPQTPDEYSNKEPIFGGRDESDHAAKNSKNTDINHRSLEEIIEKQVAKFNQAYIKSLKERIKTINENKLQMSRHIEELKTDREHLYKQLEMYHDREKMALIREQQDFKRIESLENQLKLLAAPDSREMRIVIPDKNAYDADAEIQDEHKKAPGGDPHPEEALTLKESSDLEVSSNLHDKIHSKESSGFVSKENRDYPAVGESIEKPAHEAFLNIEKENIEDNHNEKANRTAKPIVSEEDEEVRKPETPVKMQDLKHIESAESDETARLKDIFVQSLLEEATVKGDDESHLAHDPVPKYMALGTKASKKEDYDKAIEYFLKVVDILPTAGTVVSNLADLYFLKKEYETARKYAAQALELGEESATLVLEKINTVLAIEKGTEEIAEELQDTICIERSALDEAVDSTDNATAAAVEDAVLKGGDKKIDPKKEDARKYMALGVKAASQKDYHKAIEHFSKAVEILPDSAAGFCNLAVLNYRLKEYEIARRHAEKSIDLGSPSAIQILEKIKPLMAADFKSPAGFEPAAEIKQTKYSQVAKKDEAEDFFIGSDAVTLNDFLKTEKQNQSDLAVDKSLREKDAVINNNFKLGLAAFEKKEFRKAIGHFNKVVELLPNGVPSYIHLTKIHYHLGEYSQARKHAKKAFELGDFTLKPILKKIDAKLAKESEALPSTGSMEFNKQETPSEAIEGTEEEPEVLESRADSEPVKKKVKDETNPQTMVETPVVEFVEPVASAKAGDSRENTTSASIEKAVSKEDDAEKYMALGVEATEQKDYRKAVKHFSKAVEILPDNAVGFFNLAALHYNLENYNIALKHAEKALSFGLDSAESILEKIKSKITTASKTPPAKKTEKSPKEEAPIETDESKPDHITEAQVELPDEEPKETLANGKAVLKQVQGLSEPAGSMQPAAEDGVTSETLPPAKLPQEESQQGENGSTSEYFKLGLAASEKNDFDNALDYFNKVAMALPKVPYSFLNMADVHYRMKNYKTARKHAERALELGAYSAHRMLSKIEDSLAESKNNGSSPLLPLE